MHISGTARCELTIHPILARFAGLADASASIRLGRRLLTSEPEQARTAPCAIGERPRSSLAETVVYKIAGTLDERAGAFRLLHDAYVRAGLMRRNVFQMRVTRHFLLPTTTTFVALDGGKVIATLSLVADGRLGLPLERAFANEVKNLRRQTAWLAEVSALASLIDESASEFNVVVGLMRIMAQFSRRNGMDRLLAGVHPRHARFYRRTMGFQLLGRERAYPAVCNQRAVALHLDLSNLHRAPPENVMLFFGEPIPDEQLRFSPISPAERRHFAAIVNCDACLAYMRPMSLSCA